ncbi:MAG: transglycosylase domain-containing protein, partial [Gammaproteobacteria bacterium]
MATKSPLIQRLPTLSWHSLLFISLPVVLIAFAMYVVYLDHTVRVQFEGKRWALPARVYARPLELFQDMKLNPETLAAELNDLGYVQAVQPDGPGTYSRTPGSFRFVTRSFRFWDTSESSQPVTAVFDSGTLSALRNTQTGARLDLVRLDALPVGGIYPAQHEDRILIQVKETPPLLIKALIDMEDRRFYKHHGINAVSILRAFWVNLRAGSAMQGGSTLTQQLVKNFYLTTERTLSRKLNEVIMAVLLELHYSKDEILEAYLNEIFLGQDGQRAIHGFGLASQFYFGRPLNELNLPQLALLVGMVPAPSSYEPRQHTARAITVRNRVLDAMLAQQDITAEQLAKAKQTPLGVTPKPSAGASPYPAFMDLLRRQLQHDYKEEDLTSEGLQVFTAFDPQIQRVVESALSNRIASLEKAYKIPEGKLEGAVIVTDTQNGEVLALVGGRDARYTGFNRALAAQRPIGSLIKPVIYLSALAQPQKYTLVTPLDDSAFTLKNPGSTPWS